MPDVILPVLNEADALPVVLRGMPSGYTPIVVDNGSTDDSADVARSLGARVVTEHRRGFGAACQAGLMAATDEIVCFMDCDGSLDPKELPLVADPVVLGDADLVLGARHARPGAWPLHAQVANAVLAWRLRRNTGAQVSDLGPMRSARRAALIGLELRDRRFGWPLEMVLAAAGASWVIDEVGVSYGPRIGVSKVTGTVRGSANAMRDMLTVMHTTRRACGAEHGVR